MKKLSCITVFILICRCLSSQLPIGSWSDHLRYNTAKCVAVSQKEVFASNGSSILVYNKEFSELKKMSKVNGLSETGVSAIGWSEENSTLIIAYTSSNIDLVNKNSVYNIPDIMDKNISGDKRINRIRTRGNNAYLATDFGIVIIDLVRMEVHDTWRPGPGPENNEVFDIAFGNNTIYAATDFGSWYADLTNQGLAYFGNWNQIRSFPDPDSRCTLAVFSGLTLYLNVSRLSSTGDMIYAINDNISLLSFTPGVTNNSFDPAPQGFTVSSSGSLKYYGSNGSLKRTISSYGWGIPNISQGIIQNNDVWIGDLDYGLLKGNIMNVFDILSLNGPASNDVADIVSADGRTIICAGGVDNSWNRLNSYLMVSVYENNQFLNIISDTQTDAIRAAFDPGNSSHFFVSSWGGGLLEYKNNSLTKQYDASNSPLQNGNTPGSGVKICGLAMDKSKNLWITGSDVAGSIRILKPDGTWISYPVNIGAPIIGDIISTENGQKWITLPGGNGLFIINDNNTPENFTDDRTKRLTVTDSDGKVLNTVYSVAEDLDGNVWIGTDQGPVIYYNTANIFDDDVRGYRIKIPRNDGSGLADYLLGTESITSIAVDGANLKWLGTKSSGVYQLSADGATMIKNYNIKNSPLFSDFIASVAVDNITGEIWFGTSKGVLSVREIATSGKESFSKVYSFPNPVREDFSGNVTITGLMKDTEIKITDVSGNLVYETVSEGGQASWNLSTYNGHRVSTGVYLIFCATNDGSMSCVTKILVIGK